MTSVSVIHTVNPTPPRLSVWQRIRAYFSDWYRYFLAVYINNRIASLLSYDTSTYVAEKLMLWADAKADHPLTTEAVRNAYAKWRALWVIAHTSRDANAQCPACGERDGEIRWAPAMKFQSSQTLGVLLHVCHRCRAVWGEKPIIKADDWNIQEEVDVFEPKVKKNAT